MTYHQKSVFILFLIITTVLLSIIGFLYLINKSLLTETSNVFLEEASLEIKTNWGECQASFPCYETYELRYSLGSSTGDVFHNGELLGTLPNTETEKLIKASLDLYQYKKCTPFYLARVTQNYELTINKKVYNFGNNQGCKEMQSISDTIKEQVVYNKHI